MVAIVSKRQWRKYSTGTPEEMCTLTFDDPIELLCNAVLVEFVYGGKVTDWKMKAGEQTGWIETSTPIMGKTDVSRFEGPTKILAPLWQLIKNHWDPLNVWGDFSEKTNASFQKDGPDSAMALAWSWMGCEKSLINVTLRVLGIAPEEIKAGGGRGLRELLHAARLSNAGLCTFQEALTLFNEVTQNKKGKFADLDHRHIVAAFQLKQEGLCTFAEAISIALEERRR